MALGDRTRRWAALALGAALLALAGCGEKQPTLHIYNWSDYIDPALIKAFEAETGVKVVYDTFDTAEMLETKVLTGGSGYDIVVPANHNVPRLLAARTLAPLDVSRLPGREALNPGKMALMEPFDPGGRYTLPYMSGTVGIGFNRAEVEKRLPGVALDSWDVVFKPANLAKLKDCGVHFLDAPEDMFAIALHYLGKDANSTDPADYAAAADLLLTLRPYVAKFHSSEYVNALANGDACVAIGYSGDVLQARDRAEEAGKGVVVDYVVPREGSQIWFGVFAIPADAPNPDAAYAFLAYMLRPQVIARASNYIEYANLNDRATPLVDAEVRDNPAVYPTPEVLRRLFVTTAKDQALLQVVTRQWVRVTTGK
ncbi:MAG: polyamine ABC transporter substrate-binding protein [Pseudomonadota bacterium]